MMGIVKMHPLRKWLIELLGGTVMIPGPVGRVKTLQVCQLNATQSLLATDEEETNEGMRREARIHCAQKLAEDLLEESLIDFEEVRDGYFWNVRGSLRVVVEDK